MVSPWYLWTVFVRAFYIQLSVFRMYPNEGTHIIALWCNGNTSDFGPAVPGSNPGGATTFMYCEMQ